MKAAATLIALGSFASVNAAIVTWDNGGADGLWDTAANWDNSDTAPVDGDTVIIDTTVAVTKATNFENGLDVTLSNSATLANTLTNIGMGNSTFNIGSGSSLSGNVFRMWGTAKLVFDDGADLNGNTEFRDFGADGPDLQFNLGATGFTTVTAGGLGFWSGDDLSEVNFTVDLTNYTAGAATITLIDWTGGSGSQALLDAATQTIIGGAGNLIWDDTNKAVQLSIVPEPSTAAALLGLGALGLVVLRRRK